MTYALRYVQLVLRHRWVVLVGCAALTIASGFVISRAVLASSLVKLFFADNPKYEAYRERTAQFGGNDVIIIAVEHPDVFSASGWRALQQASDALREHPQVRDVRSVAGANRIEGSEELLRVEPYGEAAARASSPQDYAELRRAVQSDPFVENTLLSRDGEAVALLVELVRDDDRSVEALPALLRDLSAAVTGAGFARDRLRFAGTVPESVEATKQTRFNIVRILPLAVLVLAVVVYLLFGQMWPVLLTTGVALVAVSWTFAVAVLMDRHINLLMAVVPAVMIIICFSDIIHLLSAYLQELRAGRPRQQAIEQSGADVGLACFYTSMTTGVGFVAMAFVPTPIFRKLGVVLGVGVAIALLLAMTLVPIALSLLPQPDLTQRRLGRLAEGGIDWLVALCRNAAARRSVAVMLVFAVAAGAAVWGVTQLRVETSMVKRLAPDNPTRAAHAYIQNHFSGVNILDLYLSADADGAVLEPELLQKVRSFQRAIGSWEGVDNVRSLVDLLQVIHRELGRDGRADGPALPQSRPLVAQYLLLFDMSGGEGLGHLVDDARRTLRLTVRLSEPGFVATRELGNRAARLGERMFGDTLEVEPGSLSYLFGDWIRFILRGQARGLVFAFIMTSLMMILIVRRVPAGLVSMIPNALPIVFLGGYLGLSRNAVDSDVLIIGMIAIGIAVDDTIHVLTRLKLEAERHADITDALRATYTFAGRAIVKTTAILSLGFLPFVTSDYFSVHIFGTLLPAALILALAGDLVLVPALVYRNWLRLQPAALQPEGATELG